MANGAAVELAVQMSGIRKTFGRLVALNDVSFAVRKGEIHGLLGENGAGKSTLMNVLYGLYHPDSGTIRINGDPAHFSSPADSIRSGIGMVHQASTLVPSYTAVENIIIGSSEPAFDLEKHARKIESVCGEFGFDIPLRTRVETLSVGTRQKIEIVRALYRNARTLILDEPTTSLVESEFEQLKRSLRSMSARGISCIFITHKIREARDVCDRATVLRKGRVEGTVDIKDSTKEQLVSLMFMEKNIAITDSALPLIHSRPPERTEKPICELRELRVKGREKSSGLRELSLKIYGGEILGIAGVSGNGQKELSEAIVNPASLSGGEVLFQGESLKGRSICEVFRKGVAYTPEDRIREAILPEGSLVQNLVLAHFSEKQFHFQRVFIDWAKAAEKTRQLIRDFEVKAPGEKTACRRLSGGNIQKTVLGRALINPVDLLIVDNPCSGLDIATVELILNKLVEIRNAGKAVLWINEDLDELMLCCDRIGVLFNGELVGEVERKDFDKYLFGEMMTGGRQRGE